MVLEQPYFTRKRKSHVKADPLLRRFPPSSNFGQACCGLPHQCRRLSSFPPEKQPPPAVRASAVRQCRPNLHSPARFSCQRMQKVKSSVLYSTKMARSVGKDASGCAFSLSRWGALSGRGADFKSQEKRYRSMQEHIRRAHPDHYIPKLPATEESFQLMITTPPTQRPQIQSGVGIGPCTLAHYPPSTKY